MTTPTEFLRLVLDRIRLAILGAAALGPVDVDALAAQLEVTPKEVLRGVGRLREAGLLDGELRLDLAALRRLGEALPGAEGVAGSVIEGPWSSDEAEILARFFQGSRLVGIPTQQSKRRVVLERLALEFEPGLRYTEREVNLLLQVFHPDYAALRRYLVDEGFLTRAEGFYWRSGGRVS